MTDHTTADRPEVDDPRVLALAEARQQMAYENPFNAVCPPWDGLTEQEQHLSLLDARNYLRAALKAGLVPAVVPSADRAAVPAPAEPFPIWAVWREDQPAYGYFATEDIAKHASIDCWEEDEPSCPDYSWRPDGGPGNWELLVGDERAEVHIRRQLVWGGLPQPPRAAVLLEAADVADGLGAPKVAHFLRGMSDGAGPRRLAGEAAPQHSDTAVCVHCGQPVNLITGTLTAWWVHDPGGNTMCHPQQGAVSPRATPSGEAAPDNTETRGGCGCPSEDAVEHQFGGKDCDCVPFTRQGGQQRYCGPDDTVDMISGWEIGPGCPHHRDAIKARPGEGARRG